MAMPAESSDAEETPPIPPVVLKRNKTERFQFPDVIQWLAQLIFMALQAVAVILHPRILVFAGWYFFTFYLYGYDTTVASDGDRIHNSGLLNDRICGMMTGSTLLIVGAILFVSERKRPTLFDKIACFTLPAIPFAQSAIRGIFW